MTKGTLCDICCCCGLKMNLRQLGAQPACYTGVSEYICYKNLRGLRKVEEGMKSHGLRKGASMAGGRGGHGEGS